jgi:hypothetical protein
MSQGDFFDEEDQQQVASQRVASNRRRTRTIALVALGGVTALGVYSCMRTDEEERVAQQANAGAGVPGVNDANGQQQQTQHRTSYFPWFWMMSRGGMFGGGGAAPMPGATSGFNAGGGTATAGRAGSPTAAPSSTSTSRGGFGAFGRALSGLS